MGVYINMEMPKSCDSCRIMAFEDTNCVNELYCGCPIVFKAHPPGVDHRPDYCPLIGIPPHGDLIDANKLAELCDIMADKCDGIGVSVWHQFKTAVECSPIVIPAEEEK